MAEIAQVSFTKGEVSPIAAARTDAAFYQNAVGLCSDFFIRAEGAASNRPGLQYIGPCLSNTPNGSYFIPFVYNNQQAYLTEWSAGAMQFYSQGAFVQNLGLVATITGMTAAGHTMVCTCTNSFSAGQQVTIAGVVSTGAFNPNQIFTIATASGTQFTVAFLGILPSFTYVSGGTATVPYNLTNPYQFADLPNLRWAQSADTLTVVVNTQQPYELKRVTPTSFTYLAPTLLNGPFQDVNTDGTTTVYASATQGSVTLTASAPIFLPSHVGALFYLEEQFLNSISPWEAQKILVYPNGSSPVGMYIRSDGKIYQCVSAPTSSDHTATGTFQPVHVQGTLADGDGQPVPNFVNVCGVSWQFVSTNAGVALITGYIDPHHVTAVVQSDEGVYSNFPPTVVGGPQVVFGPFTKSGDGSTVSFTGLSGITTADPNQFYVTVNGVFQDPSTYTISTGLDSITFYTPPAAGTNNVVISQITGTLFNIYYNQSSASPVKMTGLCLSTYWAFGSFSSIQGYPATAVYFNDRLVFGGTQLQPQTFFTSKTSIYHDFGVSVPQIATDGIVTTVNARRENPIVDLMPLTDLLIGTASTTWRVTHSASVGAITPSDISLLPQNFYGEQAVPSVQTGDTVIYVQWGGRKVRDLVYQFQFDKYIGTELTVFARQMFPYGTTVTRMAYAPEPYGLIYCVRSDGVLCVCTYLTEQTVTAWSQWHTQGAFEDVCVLPENGGYSVYVIVRRVVNGQTVRYIERFAPREYATTDDMFFVDCGLTYDGRNTSSTTMTLTGGTTWLANDVGTLTASSGSGWAGFTAQDVTSGNAIWLYDANGNRARMKIVGLVSGLTANVQFLDFVPATLQGIATGVWTFAKTNFTGLTQLIGSTVVICADSATQPAVVVDMTGSITLSAPGGVVHAGLSYTPKLQSLNLNQQGQPSIRNKSKNITGLSIVVDTSSTFFVGPDFEHLFEVQERQFEDYGEPTNLHTGLASVEMSTTISDDSTLCIQHNYPLPLTILGWIATVSIGESAA